MFQAKKLYSEKNPIQVSCPVWTPLAPTATVLHRWLCSAFAPGCCCCCCCCLTAKAIRGLIDMVAVAAARERKAVQEIKLRENNELNHFSQPGNKRFSTIL